ncbi:MAG: small multi-drug export protein [Faecalibacterium sp.]|nr:small multi-drug export protein [Muribaculaceae bacterium]MCM1363598.1 small multi-drug export protein [Ruminococcus sp.]MCM1484697.1 small multi-drug export protein [Faecalibacterium sp.]
MSESIVQFFIGLLGDKAAPEFITFIISLFPVLELRGGLIAAKLMDVEFIKAFIICYIGNMLPIPFILFFIRKIFNWLKRFNKIEMMINKLEARSIRKADKVKKYRLWGLFLLVAIPLPGTGAWTGALIADLLDIRIKNSLPVIAVGVFVAGIITSLLSYGLLGAIGV